MNRPTLTIGARLTAVLLAALTLRAVGGQRTETTAPASAASGAWGSIQWETTWIEAPLPMVQQLTFPASTEWCFPGLTNEAAMALVRGLKLPADQERALCDPARFRAGQGGTILTPPEGIVRRLPATARVRLYEQLAQWPANQFHCDPVFIDAATVDEWAGPAVSESARQVLRQCAWRQGDALVFSDVPLLLETAKSAADKLLLMKAMTRTRALIGRLVTNAANPAMPWWTAGGRHTTAQPLLESAMEGSGRPVDVSSLLPPVPRGLLNTFWQHGAGADGLPPDCHWTCLNFFRAMPDLSLTSPEAAGRCFGEHYAIVSDPPRYGDVWLFRTGPEGSIEHSCVCIAGDVVLTKNGRNPLAPWVLMRLAEVQRRYERRAPHLSRCRLKLLMP